MSEPTFKLDIDPEAVNKAVANAVIESSLGESIKGIVDRKIDDFRKDYNVRNAIESAVNDAVKKYCNSLVQEHGERIRALVNAYLTDDVLQDMVTRYMSKAMRGY